jgi:hypothetical protein
VYIGPDPRLFDTASGHHDLTERRLASGFDENQTFVAIFYSSVLKMQHSDGRIGTPSLCRLGCVLVLFRDRCAMSADRPDHPPKRLSCNPFALAFADFTARQM